jgi:hypothetical protein
VSDANVEKFENIFNDSLMGLVIKPRHFDNFDKQHDHRVQHLPLAAGAVIRKEVESVFAQLNSLSRVNLRPIVREQVLQCNRCEKLGIGVICSSLAQSGSHPSCSAIRR